MNPSSFRYRRLLEVSAVLAANPEDQLKHLPEGLGELDEFALTFDDVFQCIDPEMSEEIRVVYPYALSIDQAFKAMSGKIHVSLWELTALNLPQWSHIRLLAKKLLEAAGNPEIKPSLDGEPMTREEEGRRMD